MFTQVWLLHVPQYVTDEVMEMERREGSLGLGACGAIAGIAKWTQKIRGQKR